MDRGFSIKALIGSEAALEALVKRNYDLIIVKFSRGGKDILTVLRQAKKIKPLTKIMLITNSLELAFPLEAYDIDIDDYISMPISAGEFWRRVENRLDGLVVDRIPENSVSQSGPKVKLIDNHVVFEPMVSVTGP